MMMKLSAWVGRACDAASQVRRQPVVPGDGAAAAELTELGALFAAARQGVRRNGEADISEGMSDGKRAVGTYRTVSLEAILGRGVHDASVVEDDEVPLGVRWRKDVVWRERRAVQPALVITATRRHR